MEIIKGYKTTVRFPVPSDIIAAQAAIFKNGSQIGPFIAATITDGVALVDVPYNAVNSMGDVVVTLTFPYEAVQQNLSKTFTVAQAYLDLWELREILPSAQFTDSQVWEIEAAVRNIINVHCRQKFGVMDKTIRVLAIGDDVLNLPERLITLNSIYVNGLAVYDTTVDIGAGYFLGQGSFILTGDGTYIRATNFALNSFDSDVVVTVNGAISYPFDVLNPFKRETFYDVTGSWGWSEVPTPVSEAAKLLINDYACAESLYRDRYLRSITAADWVLEYAGMAYLYTGNVRADQLLEPYVRSNWVVI